MRILGITGGIGTGKSAVGAMFGELGAKIIDADVIVRELQQPGTPLTLEIARLFGPEMLTESGELNRTVLGKHVFKHQSALEELNRISHPPVRLEIIRRLKDARESSAKLVFLDIPLLFENRQKDSDDPYGMEATILVYAPLKLQIERQIRRDGVSLDHAKRRIESQMSIEEKRNLADYTIDNSRDLEHTRKQVESLYDKLMASDLLEENS